MSDKVWKKFKEIAWDTRGKTTLERSLTTANDLKTIYNASQKEVKNKPGLDTKLDRKKILKEYDRKRAEFLESLEDDTKVKPGKIATVDNDDPDGALEVLQETLSADMKMLKKLQDEAKKNKGNRE